jgi:hypothetical protein
LALRSEIIDNIKPAAALAELGTSPALIQLDRAGSAQVFTLRVRPFLEMCRQLAETALARGEVPPWRRQIPRA